MFFRMFGSHGLAVLKAFSWELAADTGWVQLGWVRSVRQSAFGWLAAAIMGLGGVNIDFSLDDASEAFIMARQAPVTVRRSSSGLGVGGAVPVVGHVGR
jgi:hypothetical protein